MSEIYNSHRWRDTESEAFLITKKLFEAFTSEVLRDGAVPIIVLFPSSNDIRRYWLSGEKVYQPLIDFFEDRQFAYIDLLGAFENRQEFDSIEDLRSVSGHYSALANRIVASYLLAYLRQNEFSN